MSSATGGYQRGEGVITAPEAEAYIENLETFDIDKIGSHRWMRQHDFIEKLNVQAHHCVLANTDEFVAEALVSFEKIPVLIHELLAIEIWKNKVYPLLKDAMVENYKQSIKPYVLMYHEAAIVNLLECALFHPHACVSAGDSLMELADYCYRKLTLLNAKPRGSWDYTSKTAKELLEVTEEESMQEQFENIEFSTCMCSLTLLRFLTEHVSNLSLSMANRLVDTNDFIVGLSNIMEQKPWVRRHTILKLGSDGQPTGKKETTNQNYVDGQWIAADALQVNKVEAQVWLALNNLLVDPQLVQKYNFNSYRKESVFKLKRFFHEALIDQLPVLVDLQRAIETLALMDPPHPTAAKSALVIEAVPDIRNRLMKGKDWQRIADQQRSTIFAMTAQERKEEMTRLAEMYNLSSFEEVLEDPKCAQCGKPAEKRCSRCKNEWYCGRDCQVKAWATHKPLCDIVAKDLLAKK